MSEAVSPRHSREWYETELGRCPACRRMCDPEEEAQRVGVQTSRARQERWCAIEIAAQELLWAAASDPFQIREKLDALEAIFDA